MPRVHHPLRAVIFLTLRARVLGLVGAGVGAANQAAIVVRAAAAPRLTPLVSPCAPCLTSLVSSCAPRLTPLHTNRLSLSIRYCQYRRDRREAETVGMERRQSRRAGRHERRQARRTGRTASGVRRGAAAARTTMAAWLAANDPGTHKPKTLALRVRKDATALNG